MTKRLHITKQVRVTFSCGGCQRQLDFLLMPSPPEWESDKAKKSLVKAAIPEALDNSIRAIQCPCGHENAAVNVIPIQPGVELLELRDVVSGNE